MPGDRANVVVIGNPYILAKLCSQKVDGKSYDFNGIYVFKNNISFYYKYFKEILI